MHSNHLNQALDAGAAEQVRWCTRLKVNICTMLILNYLIQVTLDVIWIIRCHIFVLFVMADVWQLAGELIVIRMLHQE